MRISDWSSDVCSSDLVGKVGQIAEGRIDGARSQADAVPFALIFELRPALQGDLGLVRRYRFHARAQLGLHAAGDVQGRCANLVLIGLVDQILIEVERRPIIVAPLEIGIVRQVDPLDLAQQDRLPRPVDILRLRRIDGIHPQIELELDRAFTSVEFLLLLGVQKRSEEHTSELQSLMRISYAVLCLKKKKLLILVTY